MANTQSNNYLWPVELVCLRRSSLRRDIIFAAANPACPRTDSTNSVFAQDSLEEGNNNSVVYLIHGITPVHRIDAEVLYEPERVETKVGPRLLSLRFLVTGA